MVLRVAADRFEIVWSHHHIILDGWSIGLLIAELLEIYIALRANVIPKLATTPSFATFVKWLQAQDRDDALDYWARRLQDCEEPTGINPYTTNGCCPWRRTRDHPLRTRRRHYRRTQSSGLRPGIHACHDLAGYMGFAAQPLYRSRRRRVLGPSSSGRPPEIPGRRRHRWELHQHQSLSGSDWTREGPSMSCWHGCS